jgi:predicted ATPase
MRLKLENIGIIEKADIKLDGLTVIAGENDSGKSTVGKVLYCMVKTISQPKMELTSNLDYLDWQQYKKSFNEYINSLFNRQIATNGYIEFNYNSKLFNVEIKNNKCNKFEIPENYEYDELGKFRPLVIETPFIWSILPTLNTTESLAARNKELDFEISPIINDLHYALKRKLKSKPYDIKLDIESIIKGNFIQDNGNFTFKKSDQNIELINVAMGIKYFGILQVLSNGNFLYENQILILDEPEVHLHPKWQLELAKVIVYLVSKGVKILVNSHSPYMIEALQRYSMKENIPTNFYLAENNKIIEDEQSLSKIFAKLSEPFDEFDRMDRENLNG